MNKEDIKNAAIEYANNCSHNYSSNYDLCVHSFFAGAIFVLSHNSKELKENNLNNESKIILNNE